MFGLAMIVSNEKEIIKRCLDSVYDLIDEYYIQFDSDDDWCIPVVKRLLEEKQGSIGVVPWINFGHNKSLLMLTAHERLTTKFIFWLDAKEIFIYKRQELEDEIRQHPDSNVFMVETRNGNLRYNRWQIVRNDQLYRWRFPVHEQLVSTIYEKRAWLKSVVNYVYHDGNSRRNPKKYLKYAEMCIDAINDDNDTIIHCTFYAAMSFCDYGDYNLARVWLRKYIDFNRCDDYDYISLYKLAGIDKDIEMYKVAIRKYPRYKKAYLDLARLYAERSDYKRAIIELDKIKQVNLLTCMFEEIVDIDQLITEYKSKLHDDNTGEIWRISNSTPTVIVIDNFLDNALEVREFALRQEFNITGNYPGVRTKSFRSELHKVKFQQILQRNIAYWPDGYNGSFQLVCEKGKTWWHRDKTDYSTLLFLSLDPPENTGTSIYKHKKLGVTLETPETETLLNKDSNNSDAWELVDRVANKFNRLVLFSGRYTHRADGYFGNSDETARLTQVFFYDVIH